MSGDIWVVTTGIQWVEDRKVAKHPTMHRRPHNKDLSSPNTNSAEADELL